MRADRTGTTRTRPRTGPTAYGVSRGVGVPTRDGSGEVVSIVGAGWYTTLRGHLVAVLDPGAEPGPIHLVTATRTSRPPVGSSVDLLDGLLDTEVGLVDLRGARTHRPRPVGVLEPQERTRARSGLAALEPDPDGVLRSEGLPTAEALACRLVEADLEGAAAGLVGRGGGLTPAGDDVLAGLVLGARVGSPGSCTSRRLLGLLDGLPTGEPSRAFLHWAARGHTIGTVHDLVDACATGTDPSALMARLRSIGATSGTALLAGLVLAARHLPA